MFPQQFFRSGSSAGSERAPYKRDVAGSSPAPTIAHPSAGGCAHITVSKFKLDSVYFLSFLSWWFDARETPVLIPNTEVKPCSTDDTLWGKVGNCQLKVLKLIVAEVSHR